jgi:hypothetical protein
MPLRIHHLNCTTMCPPGRRMMDGRMGTSGPAALVCHCLLVETDRGLVLVDTGFGLNDVREPRPRLSRLFLEVLCRPQLHEEMTAIRQIERLGFKASDVSDILLTHLDFDHAGGLQDFPEATIHLTAAEAEAALGARPFPAQARRSRDSAEVRCTYEQLVGGEPRALVVSVWKGTEARPVYELRRSTYGQAGAVEEVRGLGDRAFVVKGDDGWINILKGDVYLSIQVVNQLPAAEQSLNSQELRNRTMAVARAAVGRL